MKPYYQDEWVTIYHGDCREILPALPKVDLVLTDPPYLNLGKAISVPPSKTGVAKGIQNTTTVSDIWQATLDWVPAVWGKLTKGLIVFCSYHYVADMVKSLPDATKIGLVAWYERNSPVSLRNRPHYMTQYIWLFEKSSGLNWHNLKTFYDIPKLATGCMATERYVENGGKAVHPTQKPQRLIGELLKVEPQSILDPFLGTGTTAFAAKKLNRKCIGIEIEEKYCEIAANRCRQGVFKL